MITHNLKTWPSYFNEVLSGEKTFEIRRNDRQFQVGDLLILEEYIPFEESTDNEESTDDDDDDEESREDLGTYTGRSVQMVITYITRFEQKDEFVVLGIRPPLSNIPDDQLREHLSSMLEASLMRFETRFPQAIEALRSAVMVEYMAGMGQLAAWLTDNPGLTSPEQIQRVLASITERIGLKQNAHDTESN